jgi:hypothetical protein
MSPCTMRGRCTSGTARASTAPTPTPAAESRTSFAANLLDPTESHIAPQETLTVDGKTAGRLEGFRVGVRREMWIYLLILAILLTAIEWATYHRRITV